MIHIDFLSSLLSVGSGSLFLFYANMSTFLLGFVIKLSLVRPKTSTFKELKNTPLKRMKADFKTEDDLKDVLKQIKEDPNLDISGVSDEVCLVLKSLFHIRQDVLLHTLDNIVISKMSMEVVIIELGDGSTYDRSLFLELTKLRSAMINYEAMIAVTVGFVVLLISGEEHVRELVCNHFLAKYFAPV
jgi:hypothetical protein